VSSFLGYHDSQPRDFIPKPMDDGRIIVVVVERFKTSLRPAPRVALVCLGIASMLPTGHLC
jgi:hypothetical protein